VNLPTVKPPQPLNREPPLHVARVETSTAVAEFVDETSVAEADDKCTVWLDADRDFARIEYFCATEGEARHRLAALESFIRPRFPNAPWSAITAPLPHENWAETWKRFFHAEKVSPRLWIKPSWETCSPAPGEFVLDLDPGMSFGTGQHGTTRGCLVFLDALAQKHPGQRLLDVGCGSGILAIAAARLGFTGITAMDNDPDAIRIAAENAARNSVADRIAFHTADLSSWTASGSYGVVVANILASVLIANAAVLCRLIAPSPDAVLILSGILAPQAEEVAAAFTPLGFETCDSLPLREWTTLLLQLRPR